MKFAGFIHKNTYGNIHYHKMYHLQSLETLLNKLPATLYCHRSIIAISVVCAMLHTELGNLYSGSVSKISVDPLHAQRP